MKYILKVDAEVEGKGGAMTTLRRIAGAINRGFNSGQGWAIAEDADSISVERQKLEMKNEETQALDRMTEEVHALVAPLVKELGTMLESEELSDDELRHAAGELLPALHSTLVEAGFGEKEIEDDPHGAAGGTGDDEKDEDGGKVENNENSQPGAPQQATEGGKRRPWFGLKP